MRLLGLVWSNHFVGHLLEEIAQLSWERYHVTQRGITMGLVGMWDCVAFDEVAGITFKDKDGVQIMKDYMASGSFARGKEEKNAYASMVFVGNINQSVDAVLRTSHLFDPFPDVMANDSAFLDRMHCYLPGWEIPKYRPEYFTNDYGFITDYFSEVMRELRKVSYADSINKYFKLGNNLNQRDVIAVKKTVSGLVKLIHPDGKYEKVDVELILRFALEMRRRVKEQLKKIGGMEFYDVNFSYVDYETFTEEFVSVPEQGGGKLVPEGLGKPGHIYTVSHGKTGLIGVYKLETQMTSGNGKFERAGIGSERESREAVDTAYSYLKANARNISGSISLTTMDYLMNVQDLNGIGMTKKLTITTLVAICSVALGKPVLSGTVVLGDLIIGGTIMKVEELANTFAVDLLTVPPELIGHFNIIFYQSTEDAVFKALGFE